jgi:protein-L-isoaspartate(D-aspartate) O-methyltransferase
MPDFTSLRNDMVRRYKIGGYIKSNRMEEAIMAVPREKFMSPNYIDFAYMDRPFPIPGDGRQTISAPYMYPVTYEPLSLERGMNVLEIGAGSGYGAALAKELVGDEGTVVAVEINPDTFRFAEKNLKKTGYDVEVILGDGTLGVPDGAPYDAISVTASTPEIPPPLIKQLGEGGRLIAPVGGRSMEGQDLLLVQKTGEGITQRSLMKVVYVPLLGKYGFPG